MSKPHKCKCGETDPTKFYASNGSTCKACKRKAVARYRLANPEKVSAAKKKCKAAKPEKYRATEKRCRLAKPEKYRESVRNWRKANPLRHQANRDRYYNKHKNEILSKVKKWVKANPQKREANLKRYNEKYPEKLEARRLVAQAVRSNRLKPKPCEVCGTLKTEAHHTDYSRPLDVRWLCDHHHKEEHKNIRLLMKM